MLIQKTNPVGLDAQIAKLQAFLHGRLLVKWQLTTAFAQYLSYGRCYRNRRADGYVAEWYAGNDDYLDAFWDDRYSAISFFGVGPRIEFDLKQKAMVHVIFFVNLAKLKPSISHRADMEVRNDVLTSIGSSLYGFSLQSTETWVENCLREYPSTLKALMANAQFDMHPLHCFRINFSTLYSLDDC